MEAEENGRQKAPIDSQEALQRMITSFEMKNPIDLSIDPSRVTTPQGGDGHLLASPTNARCSRITRGNHGGSPTDEEGAQAEGGFSHFVDDSKIIDLLINNESLDNGGAGGNGQDKLFEEIDMGQIDEEERQYLLIDKDTGRVYDLRNEDSLKRLASR